MNIGPFIGKVLADIRIEKGYTQDDIAECALVTLDEVQRIEAGVLRPNKETVLSITKLLGYKDTTDILKRSHNTLTVIDKTA